MEALVFARLSLKGAFELKVLAVSHFHLRHEGNDFVIVFQGCVALPQTKGKRANRTLSEPFKIVSSKKFSEMVTVGR